MRLLDGLERLLAAGDLDEGGLTAQLDNAAEIAVAVLGVDGAGLMLRLENHAMRLVGASDDSARALERAQIQLEEGPGYAATAGRTVITVADLETDGRWPALWERL